MERVIHVCFTLLLALSLLTKSWLWFPWRTSVIFTVAVLSLTVLSFVFSAQLTAALRRVVGALDRISYVKLFVLLAILSLVTKLAALFLGIDADDGDMHRYMLASRELCQNGIVVTDGNFCDSFPHTFFMAVFLAPVTRLFGISQLAYAVCFTVILTAVVLLLFDLGAIYSRGASFLAALVLILMPSQMLLPQYITHEIPMLLFLTAGVWVYCKWYRRAEKRRTKIILFALFVLLTALARLINPAGVIAATAFVLLFFNECLRKKRSAAAWGRGAVKAVCLLLAVLTVGWLSSLVVARHVKVTEDYVPRGNVMWTLFLGSNAETKARWSRADYTLWHQFPEGSTSEEIVSYRRQLLQERYADLLSHPQKAAALLTDKFKEMTAESYYPIRLARRLIADEKLQQTYRYKLFFPILSVDTALLSLVNILGLFGAVKRRKLTNSAAYLFAKLFLLGMTAMLLVTECQNKYTIAMLPFFVFASVLPACSKQNHT